MKKIISFFIIAISLATMNIHAAEKTPDEQILALMNDYLAKHKHEYVTAASVSIGYPDNKIVDYYAGTVSSEKNAANVTAQNLFQLGSITKSFASVIILQLEKEGVLNINQTIGDWLPQYPKWKNITIKQLLNMTSTIPGYVTVPELALKINNDIHHQWTDAQIIDFVYKFPHVTKGYDYSDTNYLLLAMIIEKATKSSFEKQMQERILSVYPLHNTFYYVTPYPASILNRLVHGYYYGNSTGKLVSGEDVTTANMSMAGAAGAVISTTGDLVNWVKMLYTGKLLAPAQQKELLQIVSMQNGKPLIMSSKGKTFNSGFGLGIMEVYRPEFGKYWFYGADTPGHRAYYMLSQCNQLIVTLALNSSPFVDAKAKEDGSELLFAIYKIILENQPQYHCS